MRNSKILLYVLHGAWDSQSEDGVIVLGVSVDIESLQKRLNEIAENKAREYVEMRGYIQEERGERYYEATNTSGKYAKFYITEHYVELSESLMGEISRDMEKLDRSRDVEEYLRNLYDGGSVIPWVHEYMDGNEEVMEEILQLFGKAEDCNTPFNTTMDIVVGSVIKSLRLDDEKLEYLWEKFGDILIDDDECILDDFMGFECGTHREIVWRWFDEHHSKGVVHLMLGPVPEKIVCKKCGTEVRPEEDEELRNEYPYYCPECDENKYSFECEGGVTDEYKDIVPLPGCQQL